MASHSSTRRVDDESSHAITTAAMTEETEEDISDWPELRVREGDKVESRRHPIQWGEGLQNDDEEYLDNLRESALYLHSSSPCIPVLMALLTFDEHRVKIRTRKDSVVRTLWFNT
jgi:hypothetical protein